MLAIRVARIFDGRDLLPGADVVFVNDDRIVGVEPAGVDIPGDCEVLDRPAGTLLPGLIDDHVHLVADSRPAALDRLPEFSDDDLTRTIEESLRIQLATGVTTVRDLGDTRWAVLDWRTHPVAGLPTVVASGPSITSRGGHCSNMGGEASGLDELRAAVGERAERGADIVKIMANGGMMTPGTVSEVRHARETCGVHTFFPYQGGASRRTRSARALRLRPGRGRSGDTVTLTLRDTDRAERDIKSPSLTVRQPADRAQSPTNGGLTTPSWQCQRRLMIHRIPGVPSSVTTL